tara:strand:- start:63 stop:1463 length:1401 start_codon:yes stop_codon:yes gene_type:complete
MAEKPWKFGDPYTGKEYTSLGKKVNMADGTYIEGVDAEGQPIRYIYTGKDDKAGNPLFAPEGGWSDTPEQLAADAAFQPGGEFYDVDDEGETLYSQVIRADGSVQPGGWANNPNFYRPQVKPDDADAVDSQNRRKWIVGEDSRGNPTWTRNPDYESGTKPGTKPGTTPGSALTPEQQAAQFESDQGTQIARDTLEKLLRLMFGNDPAYASDITRLTGALEQLMIDGASELEITQRIRQDTAYATRFPGMAMRAAAGLPAISEADYIDLELDYRGAMRRAGLDEEFYKDPKRFGELIEADVSAAELTSRVALAEAALQGADPAVLEQLERFYPEMDRTKLIEYYLDPEETISLFEEERRQRAAGLSVASLRATGQGLNRGIAEALERENIQNREIQTRLGQRAGLTQRTLGEAAAMTASELASGEFGLELDQATRLRRRREERVAGFGGRSGALSSSAGIQGLGTAE